ncbi:class I SAM-dependent methyltransferase [Sphingomonas sp. PR090111-T3T-6A]|uniref:class I SAM-dependent methyltransferase n=1 Tax=Sphingomonas sp. PR090111-T3T-6A TaxID=685778 RepID=UPI000A015B34|nr:class I SAM-dependent methyltransferase [Sphingomonas sp. PR090111-T3T-6A]
MERERVLESLVGLYDQPSYLEIGVQHGLTFDRVEAARKVAVDPNFLFDTVEAGRKPLNATATYHQVPSDEYFSRFHKPEDRFDVIFIDGLHSFDQTLRDLLNAVECLAQGGVIVLDDVMPVSYAASLPTLEKNIAFRAARGMRQVDWMGDVYRLVFFIRDYMRGFSYATLTENHGQMVLWRTPRPCPPNPLDVAEIIRLDFADAVLNQDSYNLQSYDAVEPLIRDYIRHHRR